MKKKLGLIGFAIMEILIGAITLTTVILSLFRGNCTKPPEILVFVLATSVLSVFLGLGIFRHNLICYHLLLYFSSIVILSKILIFTRVITLSGALETAIPSSLKNIISILYHILLIFYFTRPDVQDTFGEHRNILFCLEKPFRKKHG
jgi:hypothetical protein